VRHLGFTAGLYGTYAHRVLVLRDPSGHVVGEALPHQVTLDLVGSFGLWDRLELGLLLPVVPSQSVTAAALPGARGAGVGDLRLDLKVGLYGAHLAAHRLALAVITGLRFPTGDASSALGQPGLTGAPRLVLEWRHARGGAALVTGAVLRSRPSLDPNSVSQSVTYGAWGRVAIVTGLEVLAELSGEYAVAHAGGSHTSADEPLELDAGLHWRSPFGWLVTLGAGAGLRPGYGTPDGRLLFGVRYEAPPRAPPPAVPMLEATAPVVDTDPDRDGVIGPRDHCPTVSGPAENAGCPDEDSDGDGVVDRLDGCPMSPGDKAHHGCPLPDADGDGVPDDRDRCPSQPGAPQNDGCPDVDSDGDGLVDRLDACPFDAEVYNGVTDEDGCPDEGPVLATLEPDHIELKVPIQFLGNAVDPRSLPVLGVVARFLKLHPEVTELRVEGHTDDRGSAVDNLERSRARAVAVRRVLMEAYGVEPQRLKAQGFGGDRPRFDNRNPRARAKNNRIELRIVSPAP
jgi:hypothetical protein